MADLWLPPGVARGGPPTLRPKRKERAPAKEREPGPDAPPAEILRVIVRGLAERRTPECLKANSGRHRYAGHPRETSSCVHCGAARPEHRTCRFCRGFEPLVCIFCGGHRLGTAAEDVKAFMAELKATLTRAALRSGRDAKGTAGAG